MCTSVRRSFAISHASVLLCVHFLNKSLFLRHAIGACACTIRDISRSHARYLASDKHDHLCLFKKSPPLHPRRFLTKVTRDIEGVDYFAIYAKTDEIVACPLSMEATISSSSVFLLAAVTADFVRNERLYDFYYLSTMRAVYESSSRAI